MAGFIASYQPSRTQISFDGSPAPDLEKLGISISHSGVELITSNQDYLVLIDGYALGISNEFLGAALHSQDDAILSRIHGHYCALLIYADGTIRGFCDRYGGKTLYWQSDEERGIIISSRWESTPVLDRDWDDVGLAECLRYRWLSGQNTILKRISKLPQWYRVQFSRDGAISTYATSQQPKQLEKLRESSFEDKLDETRSALTGAINEVAAFYENAAIFLSGGVDSSLLAALSKQCFKNCLLVTSIFPGDDNPELANARAFAKTLDLQHLLVEIDESRIEHDLRELCGSNCGQISFQQIAMHQMIEAIPAEYQLLIHGEYADFAFGSNKFKRIETMMRRKRYVDLIPAAAFRLLSLLPSGRARNLNILRQSSKVDLALQISRIQYEPAALAFIQDLSNAPLDDVALHQTARQFDLSRDGEITAMLRKLALQGVNASRFKEIDSSAVQFDKKLFVPFSAEAVTNASRTLTRDQFFGKDYVKPILRELACEHYARELIYQKKHGFEVPFVRWLKGPLAHLVDAARCEKKLFDGRTIADLDVDNHYSLYWTLICWQLADDRLSARQGSGTEDKQPSIAVVK